MFIILGRISYILPAANKKQDPAAPTPTRLSTMSSCEKGLSDAGLNKISMRNQYLTVSILPEAGGKISELTDRRSGRNWLWQNPTISFGAGQHGDNYGRELDSGGWDEILLSLGAADLAVPDGRPYSVPDHGDVVGREWSVTSVTTEADGTAICRLSVSGKSLHYRLNREIHLRDNSSAIDVHYTLTNNDTFAWPCYWCAHALINIDAQTRIELPGKQSFRVDDSVTRSMVTSDDEQHWPSLQLNNDRRIDLANVFGDSGAAQQFASKIYVRSPDSGDARIAIANGNERLTMQYAPEDLPWLGLWINNNGWSGRGGEPYLNLGVEPATTAYDSVNEAMQNDAVPWIQPGETRCWSLEIGVEP